MHRTFSAFALCATLVAVPAAGQPSDDPVDPWGTRKWEPVPEEKERIDKEDVRPPPYQRSYHPVEVGEPRLPIGGVLTATGAL